MRAAPPVQAPIDGRGAWHRAQGALHALAAACVVVWGARVFEWPASIWALVWAMVAGALAAAWAGWRWPPLRGRLRWDGAAWTVDLARSGPWTGQPTSAIDLGVWMLVRFACSAGVAGADRVLWLPLSRAGGAADWPLLRAALFDAAPAGRAAAPTVGPKVGPEAGADGR